MGGLRANTTAAIKSRIKQNNAHLFNELAQIGEEAENDDGNEEDAEENDDDDAYDNHIIDNAPIGLTMNQMCDIEQMDEEDQQAKELELFSMVVRAPLQILDLDIPDPSFHLGKHTGNGREEDFILCVILKNFTGT